ncbi:hypothetical protein HEP84_56895 [Streptomyces sp. RLB1-33]|nr:hypothetical protein [Streptomyces sp. RLB1-33]
MLQEGEASAPQRALREPGRGGGGADLQDVRYPYPALNGFDRLAASEVLSAIAETENADGSTRRSIRTFN